MLELDDSAVAHRIVKVSSGQIEIWDASHDAVGCVVATNDSDSTDGQSGVVEKVRYVVSKKD